jgi:hypothetical protein
VLDVLSDTDSLGLDTVLNVFATCNEPTVGSTTNQWIVSVEALVAANIVMRGICSGGGDYVTALSNCPTGRPVWIAIVTAIGSVVLAAGAAYAIYSCWKEKKARDLREQEQIDALNARGVAGSAGHRGPPPGLQGAPKVAPQPFMAETKDGEVRLQVEPKRPQQAVMLPPSVALAMNHQHSLARHDTSQQQQPRITDPDTETLPNAILSEKTKDGTSGGADGSTESGRKHKHHHHKSSQDKDAAKEKDRKEHKRKHSEKPKDEGKSGGSGGS